METVISLPAIAEQASGESLAKRVWRQLELSMFAPHDRDAGKSTRLGSEGWTGSERARRHSSIKTLNPISLSGRISQQLELELLLIAALDDEIDVEDWTDDDMIRLHSILIERSLQLLGIATSKATLNDVLSWVFAPDVLDDGTYSVDEPYSFLRCCSLEGYDPETLRDGIAQQFRVGYEHIIPSAYLP